MLNKEQILNLVGIIASASVTAVGFHIGGTIGAEVMASIGLGLSGKIIQNGATKLKEMWVYSDNGILNSDIQRALIRAFIKALKSLETKYFELGEANALPIYEKESIKALFKEMRKKADKALKTSFETIREEEIRGYLYQQTEKRAKILLDRINESNLLVTYSEHFRNFFCGNLLAEVQLFFAEELKRDNKECNKAWRAFQRLLLEGIEADVKALHASQDLIQQDLQKIYPLKVQLARLTDLIDHRLPKELFQASLENAINEMPMVLKEVELTTRRTEEQIAAIHADIKTLAKEASKKAELGVSIRAMKMVLIPNQELGEIDFGCSVKENDKVVCGIRVYVYNNGDRSADDISLRLTFPLGLRDGKEPMKVKYTGIMGVENATKRLAYTDEYYEYVDYLYPRLDPKNIWGVQEPVVITCTSLIPPRVVRAVTKDGVPVNVKIDMKIVGPFGMPIKVEVWARDLKPSKGYFSVGYFKAKKMKELQSMIEKDRRKTLKRIRALMDKDPETAKIMRADLLKKTIAVIPKLVKVGKTQSGGYIYEEQDPDKSMMAVSENIWEDDD